jgi:DnaJ family protein A protein 5
VPLLKLEESFKWIADKNANQEEHAREQFQLIQNAWEVLSDPRERAWYNSHREHILRSGSHQAGASTGHADSDCPYEAVNFVHLRSETAFSGFCDKDARSFYGVYSRIFEQLDSQEQEAYRRQKPVASKLRQPDVAPPFGDSFANDAAVKATYVHWGNFQTIKDFAWLDEFNPSSAEGRRVRRLMEQENERRRRAGKMAFVAAVRGLAEHVKSIDPRVQLLQVRSFLECRCSLELSFQHHASKFGARF